MPLTGIEQGGYRLVWRDEANPYDKARMADSKTLNLSHGLGIILDKDGKVIACRWDSAAFNAGLVPGMRIIAVGGLAYDAETMKAAIAGAAPGNDASATEAASSRPLELIYQHGDKVLPMSIPYHDGLRWPWLERSRPGNGPTGLDLLLSPHRG